MSSFQHVNKLDSSNLHNPHTYVHLLPYSANCRRLATSRPLQLKWGPSPSSLNAARPRGLIVPHNDERRRVPSHNNARGLLTEQQAANGAECPFHHNDDEKSQSALRRKVTKGFHLYMSVRTTKLDPKTFAVAA